MQCVANVPQTLCSNTAVSTVRAGTQGGLLQYALRGCHLEGMMCETYSPSTMHKNRRSELSKWQSISYV